jgi:hypothetical protein
VGECENGCAYTLARILDPEIDCHLYSAQAFYLSIGTAIGGVADELGMDE